MGSRQLIHIKGVNQDEEIYFTAYPAQMRTICNTFSHLMEYMLTKLDHSDAEAIHIAYGIYEKTINGNYSIADIRNAIIEERQKKVAEKPVEEVIAPISQRYHTGHWKSGDDTQISDWRPKLMHRGCVPCTNCGRC